MSPRKEAEELFTENIRGKCTSAFKKRVVRYLNQHEDVTESILVRKAVREFLDREESAVKGPHSVAAKHVKRHLKP